MLIVMQRFVLHIVTFLTKCRMIYIFPFEAGGRRSTRYEFEQTDPRPIGLFCGGSPPRTIVKTFFFQDVRCGIPARKSNHLLAAVLCVCMASTWLLGCASMEKEGELIGNQPPRVWLASAPPEGTTEKYTLHLFWGGWDPDGQIAYYEYSITNNGTGPFNPADTTGRDKWFPVWSNDSTFTFSADQLADTNTTSTVAEFTRSHTFFIRAIDREGLPSIEPAYRSFTARTLSPRITINIPRKNRLNPALVPPITTFSWTAVDFVSDLQTTQDPESVQWALVDTRLLNEDWRATIDFLRKVPYALRLYEDIKMQSGEVVDGAAASDAQWSPWAWYRAPDDSGKSWTTPPVEFGPYVFATRAKDEAGAVTPVLDEEQNVRRVRVSTRSTGPLFSVLNVYLGSVTTSVCKTPIVILDIPAGVPLDFRWVADASSYGGTVSGYRYGWDIADLADASQWETDYTPFTSTIATAPSRQFFFGTHTFSVEVVDNSGFCSRVEIKVNIIQFSMQRSLLVVDDFPADETFQAGWNNQSGNAVLPSDEEHKDFWIDMTDNVDGFVPEADMIQVSGNTPLRLATVAGYKSIIWSVFGAVGQSQDLPLIYQYVQYRQKNPSSTLTITGKREPNLLALFMAAGGHLLITGRHPASTVINRTFALGSRFPFMFLYDMEGGQDRLPDVSARLGDQSFAYKELCLETLDFAIPSSPVRRDDGYICSIQDQRPITTTRVVDEGMREAIPLDPAFPRMELRPETASGSRYYAEQVRSYEAEVYNPQYFFDRCVFAVASQDCFEPIYGLHCLKQSSVNYGQPVAFWTSSFADRVAEVQGAVAARSAVFGFPPVYFKPAQVKPGIEHILFCEWQLPAVTPISCVP